MFRPRRPETTNRTVDATGLPDSFYTDYSGSFAPMGDSSRRMDRLSFLGSGSLGDDCVATVATGRREFFRGVSASDYREAGLDASIPRDYRRKRSAIKRTQATLGNSDLTIYHIENSGGDTVGLASLLTEDRSISAVGGNGGSQNRSRLLTVAVRREAFRNDDDSTIRRGSGLIVGACVGAVKAVADVTSVDSLEILRVTDGRVPDGKIVAAEEVADIESLGFKPSGQEGAEIEGQGYSGSRFIIDVSASAA